MHQQEKTVFPRLSLVKNKENLDAHSQIHCEPAPLQYVGETKRRAVTRLKEHICDMANKGDTPLASHFWKNEHCLEQSFFDIIEIISENPDQKSTESRRLNKETF